MPTQPMAFFTLETDVTEATEQSQPAEPVVYQYSHELADQERIRRTLSQPATAGETELLSQSLRTTHRTTLRGVAGQPGARVDYIRELETMRRHAFGGPTTHTECEREVTLQRRPDGLVLMRARSDADAGAWRVLWDQMINPADACGNRGTSTASGAGVPLSDPLVLEHLGPLPCVLERVPLLDPTHRDAVPVARQAPPHQAAVHTLPLAVVGPWIDADNAAEVARAAFGPANYRKNLARLVAQMHPSHTAFYTHFADLVPIEHIIAAMQASLGQHGPRLIFQRLSQADHGRIRALLALLPSALCSRLLRTEDTSMLIMALRDAAAALYAAPPVVDDYPQLEQSNTPTQDWDELDASGRDPHELRGLINQMGHRRIREVTDLEHLISQIPSGVRWSRRDRAVRSRQLEYLDWLEELVALEQLHQVNTARAELEQPLAALTWQQWTDPATRQAEADRFAQQLAEQQAERDRAAARAEAQAIAARQRANAKRAAAFVRNAHLLKQVGSICDGQYRIVVAEDAATLKRWGAVMGNCIGGYTHQLGLTVLAALVKKEDLMGSDGSGDAADLSQITPVVNFQIEGGRITQVLCSRNRTLARGLGHTRAQRVLDELRAIGGWEAGGAWGVAGLDTSTSRINQKPAGV